MTFKQAGVRLCSPLPLVLVFFKLEKKTKKESTWHGKSKSKINGKTKEREKNVKKWEKWTCPFAFLLLFIAFSICIFLLLFCFDFAFFRRVAVSSDATVREAYPLPEHACFVPDNCCTCATVGSGCVSLGGCDYDEDILMFASNPILLTQNSLNRMRPFHSTIPWP